MWLTDQIRRDHAKQQKGINNTHTLKKVFGRPKKEDKGWKLEDAPSPAEWCSAVAPKSLGISGLAPHSRRYLAVPVCPCRAAWIRGVSPVDK